MNAWLNEEHQVNMHLDDSKLPGEHKRTGVHITQEERAHT